MYNNNTKNKKKCKKEIFSCNVAIKYGYMKYTIFS